MTLIHHGVPCAIPADQTLGMHSTRSGTELALWEPSLDAADAADNQLIAVNVDGQTLMLPCADARLRSLPESDLSALPEVLKSALGLPAIVGLAAHNDRILWLVDLRRLPTP